MEGRPVYRPVRITSLLNHVKMRAWEPSLTHVGMRASYWLVGGFCWDGGVAGDGEQLSGQGLDRALDRGRVHLAQGVGQDRLVFRADPGVPLGSHAGRGRVVVLPGDLRALAGHGDQFLLGQVVVGEHSVELPYLVEFGEFCVGVVAVGSRPVHALWPSSSAPRASRRSCCRPGTGERGLPLFTPGQQVVVDELPTVIGVHPQDRPGKA